MAGKDMYDVLKDEAPQVSRAFIDLIQAAFYNCSLDEKTRQLVFIGIRASHGDFKAVAAHVPAAKKAGATRDEVRDAVLMSIFMYGSTGISCLVPALEAYENG